MTERDTKTITVRASIDGIKRFTARCKEIGISRNRALADIIEAPVTVIRPVAKVVKRPEVAKPTAPAGKLTGFDATTGEPIYNRGVGPRGGKTK